MYKIMRFKLSMAIAALMTLATFGMALAQDPAYTTSLITSVTYQNVGTADASVNFAFHDQLTASAINVARTLPQGAGDSLFVGGLTGSEELPEGFLGSAVLSSNQPVVATAVQLPQSTTVKNRPLSNGFSSGSATVLLATVLKNQFNNSSQFSIQNADTGAIDITVRIFNADNPTATPIELTQTNIPQGAAKTYDMGKLTQITAASFNGSATVTAVKAGTSTPANIVASVLELGTGGSAINDAKAFEGVTGGGPKVFMATALCNVFGGTTTAYAVQNTGTTDANVTVTYSPGNKTETATISGGAKKSFTGCTVNDAGFSGAATVTATGGDIVVIGKVFGGGLGTAFLGETAGAAKLALPYVRYCNDTSFNAGSCQRVFLAIQNVSDTAINNVTVQYLNKVGDVVGTQTIASIAPGAKANSNASIATLASGAAANALTEFGQPTSNPGGGFGGAVVISASGGQLIAIARVQSRVGSTSVAEDFNGIPIQ
ncbi:MAG: hypothetical protein R2867_28900 [Caldilineaceae bacterium]